MTSGRNAPDVLEARLSAETADITLEPVAAVLLLAAPALRGAHVLLASRNPVLGPVTLVGSPSRELRGPLYPSERWCWVVMSGLRRMLRTASLSRSAPCRPMPTPARIAEFYSAATARGGSGGPIYACIWAKAGRL